MFKNILIFVVCVIILFALPIVMDELSKKTILKTRKKIILEMAKQDKQKLNVPLLIFENKNIAYVDEQKIYYDDIYEFIDNLKYNKYVIVLFEMLEYHDSIVIYNKLKKLTDCNIYTINISNKSPKLFFDFDIKHIIDINNNKITKFNINKLFKYTQKIYNTII